MEKKAKSSHLLKELFDAEVIRAIFWSLDFPFKEYKRSHRMTPECLALLLKGCVVKASHSEDNILTYAIKITVDALLGRASDTTNNRRLNYSSALCDAIAYSMNPLWVIDLFSTRSDVATVQFVPSQHLLAAAAAVGDIDQVQLLLSEGSNEELKRPFFGAAMQNAARTGREDILKMLIKNKANPPFDADTSSAMADALQAACASGHASIVNLLLETYSKAEKVVDPESAMEAAAANGHVALLQALLRRFPYPKNHDVIVQAAFAASSRGYHLVIQMLLGHSLDVNVINHELQNLLHPAARGGHRCVVQLLADHNIIYYESRWGDPLYLAAINGHQDVVRLLLDHGANIYPKCSGPLFNGSPFLSHVAENGETAMIRFLMDRGLDVHCQDRGKKALLMAAERGQEETVRLLVGMGVPVDGSSERECPMLRAMFYGEQRVVNTLLELGAKKVDPLETVWAKQFLEGSFPRRLQI